jgi:hypothetical protein
MDLRTGLNVMIIEMFLTVPENEPQSSSPQSKIIRSELSEVVVIPEIELMFCLNECYLV